MTSAYPSERVLDIISQVPLLSHLSRGVQKFIWQVTRVEDYKPGSLVSYGSDRSQFDLLYVVKGMLTVKLDQVRLDPKTLMKK